MISKGAKNDFKEKLHMLVSVYIFCHSYNGYAYLSDQML